MKLSVEVLASASIKCRKPWPQIVWAGQEKESLFLIDNGRISVLFVPSGKTKKKIPKLSPLVEEAVCITPTKNGLFLVGLLKSGNIFLWHKDRDVLKTVTGLCNFLSTDTIKAGCAQLCVSDDCSRILVIVNWYQIWVWQQDPGDSFANPASNTLSGKWMRVNIPQKIPVTSLDCLETSVAAIFYNSQVLGECCQCSITFNNKNMLCVTTMLLRFSEFHSIYKDSIPSQHAEWSCLQYPIENINPNCQPIDTKGAYVTCYSHDGQVMAVAANQMCPSDSSMIFVSPLTETLLVSDMRDCGVQNARKKTGRCYWVSAMSWTYDNLFLACILRNGSVSILSRLGEPIVIQTTGCSIELGPSRFIPIHPVIRVQKEGETEPTILESEDDPMQQVFSVSTHPSLPIMILSDGYMVTVVQLPCETTCMTFMRDLVIESSKHLKYIQDQEGINLTLASPYNLPLDKLEGNKISDKKRERMSNKQKNQANVRYSFESLDGSLNETQDSEVSAVLDEGAGFGQFGAMQNLSSGKILFGEPEMLMATVDSSYLSMAEQESVAKRLQNAKVALFMSWKLAVSHCEAWTPAMDTVSKSIVQNFIKVFSLILNCPAVTDMIYPSVSSASIQNTGLFQVITMYRQLLELLQFDIFQQHLIPVSLQLMHRTAAILVDSPGLDQVDPRLKTLSGCYTLIKFSEKNLNKTYVFLPKSVSSKAFTPRSGFGIQDNYQQGRVDGAGNAAVSQLLSKRFSYTWTMLYKSLVLFQNQQCQSEAEYRQAMNLICQIQQTMQVTETPLPQQQQTSPRVSYGDKYSLDGNHTQAVQAWSRQLQAIGAREDSVKAAKTLHSLLYTYLLRGELLTAVDFVDNLILRANVPSNVDADHLSKTTSSDSRLPLMTLVAETLKTLAFDSPDMVPCIRDKSIRQLVQTLGRFMAAYFSNQTVYIFPPHNPQPLPAIHLNTPVINNRIIPKYHEDITHVIRQNKLENVWTVERTLEYLLLSGLTCEGTWFADQMGDWKAAFMMSVGCVQHRHTAQKVYEKSRKPLQLPDSLLPGNILQKKLGLLLGHSAVGNITSSRLLNLDYISIDEETNTALLTHTVEDMLTAGLVGRVEEVPWLLTELVAKLKIVVSQFSPLVPDDFYLPAPPLYCPQPTSKLQESIRSLTGQEKMLRKKTASLVQLTLCVLKASHLSLPVVNWYIKELTLIQNKATQFKANMEGPCMDLPDLLKQHLTYDLTLTQHEENPCVQQVLSSFRDFVSILWMLHARDQLSICLRHRQNYLDKLTSQDKDKSVGREHEKWLQKCFINLQWAVHLLTFSRFLPDEGCVYKVILSLLLELPPSEDTANILAEYFYDMENLDAEVQEKLDKIVHEWQTIIVKPENDGKSAKVTEVDEDDPTGGRKSVTFLKASPRGKSLSVYFHKQCQGMAKVLKKRRICFGSYDEFLFSSQSEPYTDLNIGSRPFETKVLFIEFMDTFCSVSFGRLLETELERDVQKRYPLLTPWADFIMHREMTAFMERPSHGQRKHSLLVMTPRDGSVDRLPRGEEISVYRREQSAPTGYSDKQKLMSAKGLFRSKSAVDVGSDRSAAPVRRYESEYGIDEIVPSPGRSKHGSQKNLSQLASKFSQSEEALYQREDSEQYFWSLNVNFGRRYMPLKTLLEWLENWSRKSHSLGLGKQEQKFGFKPTMKIHVPSHLVLLSLWLLENKYIGKPQMDRNDGKGRQSRSRRRLADVLSKNNNAQENMAQSAKSPQGQSPSKDSLGVRTLSPSSLKSSAVLEEENVRSAYEQLLDGPDDSSSIGVSSLNSDEMDGKLRESLSIIRGTGSPQRGSVSLLNRTYDPQGQPVQSGLDSTRDSKRHASGRGSSISPQRSGERSPHRSPSSTSRSSRNKANRSPSSSLRRQQNQSATQVDGNLANQLQNIVRTEMRRIMQVQHQSLMAMMGAIDSQDTAVPPPPVNVVNERSLRIDDLQSSSARPPMRGIMRELRNLQTTSEHHQKPSFSLGKENSVPLAVSDLERESFPKFLRVPAERDYGLRLPVIPTEAWTAQSQTQRAVHAMPLLRLEESFDPNYFHRDVSHVFQGHPPPYEPSHQENQIGFPLLRLPKEPKIFFPGVRSGFDTSSHHLLVGQKQAEHREMVKQHHLQDFQRQFIDEEREQQFGRQLLRFDFKSDGRKSPRRVRRIKSPPEKPGAQSPVRVREIPKQATESVALAHEDHKMADHEETQETEERTETETEEPADSESELHDGYAIKPGAFEAYLHLGQVLGVADTNTQFQHQMAVKMREMQRRGRKKVDFSTMTRELVDSDMLTDPAMEVVRTAEAGTSITRDTGVDPIQEAVIEYNQARQGTVVPPDVFLGLRFGEGEDQTGGRPPGRTEKGSGRSYLNVVDIRASSVLKDLTERPEGVRIQPDVSLKPSSFSATDARRMGQRMEAVEERLREGLEPPRRYGHDGVTVRVFDSLQPDYDRVSVALMPKEGIRESRVAMIRRLREMNDQMSAIDEMSHNMEADFLNTHMLINTLEAMADAAHPSGVPGEVTERARSASPVRESLESQRLTPKSSDKSPQPSARSARSRKSARTSAEVSHMSGLSGISDIIGDIIAEGGVDLKEAGISSAEADALAGRARARARSEERVRLSVEKLQQMMNQVQDNSEIQRDERRKAVQDWMTEKFSERHKQYLRQRAELKEREVHPYKPAGLRTAKEVTMKGVELQEADKERSVLRKNTQKENIGRRFEEAEMLLGDILLEKPSVPKASPGKVRQKGSPKHKTLYALSPKYARKISPPRDQQKVLRPTVTGSSPKLSQRSRTLGQTKTIPTDFRRSPSPESPSRKGILKTSDNFEERQRHVDEALAFSDELLLDSDYDLTLGSTADLLKYEKHVEEIDSRPAPVESKKINEEKSAKTTISGKPYKPQPFHEMVRLQRPEILRKAPVTRPQPTYPESTSRLNTTRDSTREEKEKLYGTKHIPGSARPTHTGPRRVKTYAERLQEMKPKRQYSTPVVPRQHVPASVRTQSTGRPSTLAKPTPKGPKHKPQTYVEQLQDLNAKAPKTFRGGKTITVQPRTFLKAHKPQHPPRSYVKQLQDINAQAPETLRRAAQRRRYPTVRGDSRPRPYSTPYRSMDEDMAEGWEVGSEVSDWTVDDDVHNLLYGGEEQSVIYTVGDSTSALDYQVSEGRSDYFEYVMGKDSDMYANSVNVDDIRDIADAASVSTGSVLSVIDWDAVDRLIEDVS